MKKAIVPLGIIVLLIFGVFMYINRFTVFHTVEVEGIVFDTTDITTNLTGGITEESGNITYKNIKINDNIYKSGKKYYIGEETKKDVVIDYPIITNDSSSVLVLSDNGNFVDEKFNKTTTYKNTIISEGTLYNGIDYSKADDAKYIFVESGVGIYTNLMEIEIKKTINDKTYNIPKHSFIYFEHSFLRYYYEEMGRYRFEEIVAIQDFDKITINGQEYEYYDFLISLGVLEPKTDKYDPVPEITPDEEEEQGTLDSTTDADSIQLPPPQDTSGGANLVDKEYVKPVVKVSGISAGVYSFKGLLDVYDPADRIYKAPTFEFYLGDSLYMRTSYSKTMNFVTTGLVPNAEYTVKCYFNYKDEYDQKRKGTCMEDTVINTKDTSELEVLKMKIGKINPDIKSVIINDIKFANKTTSEALYGLKTGYINFEDGSKVKLSFSAINSLANGEEVDYDSGNILDSGTLYKGEFVFYDIAGNLMKVSGNDIEFETLKSPPSAELEVKAVNKNFTTAYTSVLLKNPDKVNANNYKLIVYETASKKQVTTKNLQPPEKIDYYQENDVYNLKPETSYTFKVFCDYQGSDGKWVYNYELATQDIYTADFTTLGTVPTTINVTGITSSAASVSIVFPQYDANETLYQLMEETVPIVISIIDDKNGEIESSYTLFEYTKTMLSRGINFNLPSEGTLESNTQYRIQVKPYIELGLVGSTEIFELATAPLYKEFRTLKQTPEIHIANGYLASGYVDFDICIEDLDKAILTETVDLNFIDVTTGENRSHKTIKPLRSCASQIVRNENENTNEYSVFTRITDKTLSTGKNYKIEVKYPEYQITENKSDKETDVKLYPLDNLSIQPSGTSGDFELLGLTNDVNYDLSQLGLDGANDISGVNLFDISNNSRWIYKGALEGDMTQKIKMDARELVFSSKNGYKAFSYYIPELKGKDYTISYDYSFSTTTTASKKGKAYLLFSDDAVNMEAMNASFSNKFEIATATKSGSFKHHIYADDMGNSALRTQKGNYITFYLEVPNGSGYDSILTIKNLKIEIDHVEYPSYSSFGTSDSSVEHTSSYTGKFAVKFKELIDSTLALKYSYPNQFFQTGWMYKYYVNFYVDGIKQESVDTSDLGAGAVGQISETIIKRYLNANKSIEARLGVSVEYSAGYIKEHDLKTIEFTTETETRTLKTAEEFKTMHPSGYYLVDLKQSICPDKIQVSNCIDLTSVSYSQNFLGSIDFQGQAVLIQGKNSGGASGAVFSKLGGGGIVKNVDLYYLYYENDAYNNNNWATKRLVGENNGLISNIKVNYEGVIQPKTVILVKEKYEVKEQRQKRDDDNQLMYDELGQPVYEWVTVEKERTVPKYFRDTGLSGMSFIANTNNGIIENFAINLQDQIAILNNFGTVAVTNNGVVRNGYVTGKNIESGYYNGNSKKNIGAIVGTSNANSKISNVYSLIDITFNFKSYASDYRPTYNYEGSTYEIEHDPSVMPGYENSLEANPNDRVAGGITSSATSALIENALVVDPRYMFSGTYYSYTSTGRNTSYDPLIPSSSNSTINNIYFIGKDDFASVSDLVSDLMVTGSLRAPGFMKETLNKDNMFNITQASLLNQYPILIWPAQMPAQTITALPKNDAKVTDFNILSVKTVIQQDKLTSDEKTAGYKAKVEFEIYNPKQLGISRINFDGLGNDIIVTQPLAGNSDDISYFTIYIKTINKYQTKYKLTDIELTDKTLGKISCSGGSLPYFDCANIDKKDYELDLYLYVESLEQINDAIADGHNNLRLSKNITTKITTDEYLAKSKLDANSNYVFNGVIDGNGHYIEEIESNSCFIKRLGSGGTIKNLTIKKYTVKYAPGTEFAGYAGLICEAKNGSKIDNVHIGDGNTVNANTSQYTTIAHDVNTYIGGFAGTADGLAISNSSIAQITLKEINAKDKDGKWINLTEPERSIKNGALHIGGMVGKMSNTDITNSFVRNINFKIFNYIPADEGKDNAVYGYDRLENAGGIAGSIESGTVENVYATGTIDAKAGSGNVGGIVGYNSGTLRTVISKVNVYSNADNLGGLIGKTTEGSSKAMQTLALADILTAQQTYSNLDRTSGTVITANKNFAWNKQMINSKIDANTNLEELLAEEDLANTSVYQTKIGLKEKDFALNFDKEATNDDYYMIVQNEDGTRYITKQDDIKTVESEENGIYEAIYITKGETTEEVIVKKKSGTIPRLRHSETGELLANQNYDKYYDDVKIEYVEKFVLAKEPKYDYCRIDNTQTPAKEVCKVNAWDAEYVKLEFMMEVKDPDIDTRTLGFTISDMHLYDKNEAAQVTFNGAGQPVTVNVKVVADENKNYDSFNIEQITYKTTEDTVTTHTYPTKIKMVIPFYGRIDSVAVWQGIKPGTYQNYSLAADLDFSSVIAEGKTVNVGLTFNKLMGLHPESGGNYSLSNITTNADCIIKGVSSELRTVDFRNITINSTATYRVGVIKTINGKLYGYSETATKSYDVGFYDITINAPNADQVGVLAYNNSSNINVINLENITVTGKTNVGGFIGYSELKDKYNITAKNMTVTGTGNFVGGVIGYDKVSGSRVYINNVTVEGVKVSGGGECTGGAFGKAVANNVTVIGTPGYNTVTGAKRRTGGIFGESTGHGNFSNLRAENLSIRGTEQVGGIEGYGGGSRYAKSINNTIYGSSWYVGGITGITYSSRYYQYSIGNTIEGSVGVGGIVGYQSSTLETAQVGPLRDEEGNIIKETTVKARAYRAGGVVGYTVSGAIRYTVSQAVVQGTYCVGGLVGRTAVETQSATTPGGINITYNIVANSTVIATSPDSSSSYIPRYGDGTNTENTSTATIDKDKKSFYYVGGLVGRFYRNLRGDDNTRHNIVSADIIAGTGTANPDTLYGVGYVYGGSSFFYKVKSYKKVENLDEETGKITYQNVPYYSLFDWSTMNGDEYIKKYVNGKLESATSFTKVYANSKLNGISFEKLQSSTKLKDYYTKYYTTAIPSHLTKLTYDALAYYGSYSTSNYNNASSATGDYGMTYFPYPKYGYGEVIKIGIADRLPEGTRDPDVAAVAASASYSSNYDYHILPDFEIYASDVDKINIEFKETDPFTYFEIKGKKYYVNQTTYTFYYDFQEDFEVVVGDGINSKTIKISVEDIKNGVQVIGEYYYKLDDGEVITNQPKIIIENSSEEKDVIEKLPVEEEVIEDIVEQQKESSEEQTEEGEQVAYATSPSVSLLSAKKELSTSKQYVLDGNESNKLVDNAANIYGEEILLDNQNIYDITTGEIKENSFENLTLAETTPLHAFEYNGQKIETYLNYSIVDGQRVSKQIYVKNGQVEVIEQGIDNDKSQLFIQNYNDKSFVIYLGKDGKIYSLKDSVSYPKNFKNINIKSISSSLSKDTDNLLVEYEDGSYVAFNYRTGQIISEYKDKNISLIDYVKDYLEISADKAKVTATNNSYEEAKSLVSKLNKKSINQVLKGEDDGTSSPELYSRKYSIVYNPTTDKYDVYEIPTKSQTSEKSLTKALSTTVDSIIDSNPVLIKYYRNSESSKINKVSSLMITIGVVVSIICATILVGGYYKKVRKQRA